MAGLDAFGLAPAEGSIDRMQPKGEHRIDFLDVVVNNRPLRELLHVPAELAPLEFGATSLRDDIPPRAAMEQLDRLLGRRSGDYDDGRVALYLCPIDGDLWCGAVSVDIDRTPEVVTWRGFGWQEMGSPNEPELWLLHDQSFSFDRQQYDETLERLRAGYAAQTAPIVAARNAVRRLFRAPARR